MRKPSRRFLLPILVVTFSAPFAWWLTQPLRARSSGATDVTWDPPSLPDTEAGQQVAAYLEAFNSGNADALTQFVRHHFSETGPGGSSLQERARSQQGFLDGSRECSGRRNQTGRRHDKYSEAIRNARLLPQAMTEQLLTERLQGPRPGESYARGFLVRQSRAGRVIGHSGGFPGVDAQIDIYDSGWTVVVLSN